MKERILLTKENPSREYQNTKDALLQNCYTETSPKGKSIVKRFGLKKVSTYSALAGTPRAVNYYSYIAQYHVLAGNILYYGGISSMTAMNKILVSSITGVPAVSPTTINTTSPHKYTTGMTILLVTGNAGLDGEHVVTVTGASSFTVAVYYDITYTNLGYTTNFLSSTSTNKPYFLQINSEASNVLAINIASSGGHSGQLAKVTSIGNMTPLFPSNYPFTSQVGKLVYLNGYTFALSSLNGEATIWNSDVNTIETWSALSSIKVKTAFSPGVALEKLNNQIVCFTDTTIEFFYDSSNPIGSPLTNVGNNVINIGNMSAEATININDAIYFISKDTNGGLGISVLTQAGIKKISTYSVDNILSAYETSIVDNIATAQQISWKGHTFYVLTFKGSINRTIVYDISEDYWSEWSTNDGTGNQVQFLGLDCIIGQVGTEYQNAFLLGNTVADLYELSPAPVGGAATSYKDGTQFIKSTIITDIVNGGIQQKKRLISLEIVGDKESGTNNISLSWSDDDYTTWATGRTLNAGLRPIARNLGMFRNRAFRVIHELDAPFRYYYFEVEVELCTH